MRTFILIPLIYRHPRFPPIFLPAPKVAGKRGLTVKPTELYTENGH
jgi:hypothetical protein